LKLPFERSRTVMFEKPALLNAAIASFAAGFAVCESAVVDRRAAVAVMAIKLVNCTIVSGSDSGRVGSKTMADLR
jgi:hypothetical protein